MRRRSFLKPGTVLAAMNGAAHAEMPAHQWAGYDFGAGPAVTDRLNQGPFGDVKSAGRRAALVSPEAGAESFRLPETGTVARPSLEILPVQMITLALGALARREAGRFERATKVTSTE